MTTEQPEGQEPVVEQVIEGAPEAETPAPTPAPAPAPVEVTLEQVQATESYRNIQAENDRLRAKNKGYEDAALQTQRQEDAALLEEYGNDPKVVTVIQERAQYREQGGQALEQAKKIQCAQSIAQDYGIPFETLMAANVSSGAELEGYAKALKASGGQQVPAAQTPAPTQTPTPTTPARQPALEHIPDAAIATQQPLQGWPQVQQAYAEGKIGTEEYKKQASIHGKEP